MILSVVSVDKDGIIFIIGVEVVKGILLANFSCDLKVQTPYDPAGDQVLEEDPGKQPVEGWVEPEGLSILLGKTQG